MYWEVFMTVVFFVSLFIIPLDLVLNFHSNEPFDNVSSFISCITDLICIVDLTCSFLTGYVDRINKQVVLEKDKVIR